MTNPSKIDFSSTAQRDTMIERLNDEVFDVFVIGAGINGAVSAAAAAGKGTKVAIVEAEDFASSSSQESSTLAWGGIKYLENYEFKLVWGLCKSRNELMDNFPSSVVETRFVTKIDKGFRKPAFLIYLGSLLYWAMGRFKTRAPQYLTAKRLEKVEPNIDRKNFGGAFSYSDCVYRDGDARFTFNFIKSAMADDAVVVNYMSVTGVDRGDDGLWTVTTKDALTGRQYTARSKSIVNAAGAGADKLVATSGQTHDHKHLLSKGAHLIVPAITSTRHVIASFSSDGRLFFALPMAGNTCVGTTDEIVSSKDVEVNDVDRDFILENINDTMKLEKPLTKDDIIAERCGVRPLVVPADTEMGLEGRDAFDISRKHIVATTAGHSFVTIYGGKLTDCINTGNEVCEELAKSGLTFKDVGDDWFGESPATEKSRLMTRQKDIETALSLSPEDAEKLLARWWRYYDIAAHDLAEKLHPQSRMVHAEQLITDTEVEFIRETEMALTDMDIRRRRTNLVMANGL